MKKIELLDNAENTGKSLKEQGINPCFYRAYKESQKANAESLNFHEGIRQNDIQIIVDECKKFGITEFTVSDRATCGFEGLMEFTNAGCKIIGITTTKRLELTEGSNGFLGESIRELPAMNLAVL